MLSWFCFLFFVVKKGSCDPLISLQVTEEQISGGLLVGFLVHFSMLCCNNASYFRTVHTLVFWRGMIQ